MLLRPLQLSILTFHLGPFFLQDLTDPEVLIKRLSQDKLRYKDRHDHPFDLLEELLKDCSITPGWDIGMMNGPSASYDCQDAALHNVNGAPLAGSRLPADQGVGFVGLSRSHDDVDGIFKGLSFSSNE